jgi:hypothetical protein
MATMKYYLGIDPGGNGGTAALNKKGDLKLLIKHSRTSTRDYIDQLLKIKGKIDYAIIENVWGLPGQNAAANSKLDRSFGRCETALIMLECNYDLVIPKKWQQFYEMQKQKGENKYKWKTRLMEKAKELFPNNTVEREEADSVLIANYALKSN